MPLARTQETPTIESPMIDRTSQTVREKVDQALFSKGTSTGDTAELSIDDLGLDVDCASIRAARWKTRPRSKKDDERRAARRCATTK